MGRVDHQSFGFTAFGCQFGEDLAEHAKPAPPHKPIVDRLMRAVLARSIAPALSVSDDEDDPADYAPVIDAGDTV